MSELCPPGKESDMELAPTTRHFSVPKSQPSKSGCDLERRSGEMSAFSRLRGNKRYAARDGLGAPPAAAL